MESLEIFLTKPDRSCLFQSGGRSAGQGDHSQWDGADRREGLHQRSQRGVHHDPPGRVVRPDGQWRRPRHAPVRPQSLLPAQTGAQRPLERGDGAEPGEADGQGGAREGAGVVPEYPGLH